MTATITSTPEPTESSFYPPPTSYTLSDIRTSAGAVYLYSPRHFVLCIASICTGTQAARESLATTKLDTYNT